MKKSVFILCILLMNCSSDNDADWSGLFSSGPNLSGGIELSFVFVSGNMEMYLETHDVNGQEVDIGDASSLGDGLINGKVPREKQRTVTNLDISGLEINSLGVGMFTALESLNCSNNNLSTLDVSSNQELITLNCDDNAMHSLFTGDNNSIINLSLNNNQLEFLNVSGNNNLKTLKLKGNIITSLSVSLNGNLEELDCSNNQLEILTLIHNSNLVTLDCSGNNLNVLRLSNDHNESLIYVNAINNTDLECISVDPGFTPADCQLPQNEMGWCKDDTASYSSDCN